ncbi:MAG: hypothetical protein ACKVP0_15255 [Pirellulaceae bacterium]
MTATHDPHAAPTDYYTSSFSPETQKELKDEDSQAWREIVALLIGIVSGGVLLAIMCVFLTTRYMT